MCLYLEKHKQQSFSDPSVLEQIYFKFVQVLWKTDIRFIDDTEFFQVENANKGNGGNERKNPRV